MFGVECDNWFGILGFSYMKEGMRTSVEAILLVCFVLVT